MDARVGLLTSSLIRRPASIAAPGSIAPLLVPLGCFCRALSPAGRWAGLEDRTLPGAVLLQGTALRLCAIPAVKVAGLWLPPECTLRVTVLRDGP